MALLELERYTISGKGIRNASPIREITMPESAPWGLSDRIERERERQARANAWNKLTKKLIEWSGDSSCLEDDGIEPPSESVISRAYDIARALQHHGCRPFDRVVPTADGGIAFVAEAGDQLVSFEIDADGTMEFLHFRGSELASRTKLGLLANNDG